MNRLLTQTQACWLCCRRFGRNTCAGLTHELFLCLLPQDDAETQKVLRRAIQASRHHSLSKAALPAPFCVKRGATLSHGAKVQVMFPVQLLSLKPLVCLKTENLEFAKPPASAVAVKGSLEQESERHCLRTADQVSSRKLFIKPQ